MSGGARAHVDVDRAVVVEHAESLRGSSDAGLFADLEPALFLVDGGNLLWRAAHGQPAPFTAIDGRDLTPVFRFFTRLRRVLGTHGLFAECVVCFDGAQAWTDRVAIDAGYKANRSYTDVDLAFMEWLPEIRAALDCCGVANIELPTHEADDLIATLAKQAEGRRVRILSTDRDYYQLIDDATVVVNTRTRPAVVDAATVTERFGVTPQQWCDFRAITGDPSDGIPGLRGAGPSKAAALLAGGRMLEDVPELEGSLDDLLRWRELIRLRTDVDVGIELTREPTPKLPAASTVCRELGIA